MREIKFRAWSKQNTEMLHPDDVAVMPMSEGVSPLSISGDAIRIRPDNDKFVLMQYTGLKDKNGVEIYEGDIIKGLAYYDQGNGPFMEKSIVEYKAPSFNFGRINVVFTTGVLDTENLEVIGNIWENPELLKELSNE